VFEFNLEHCVSSQIHCEMQKYHVHQWTSLQHGCDRVVARTPRVSPVVVSHARGQPSLFIRVELVGGWRSARLICVQMLTRLLCALSVDAVTKIHLMRSHSVRHLYAERSGKSNSLRLTHRSLPRPNDNKLESSDCTHYYITSKTHSIYATCRQTVRPLSSI
jgi:hypothetical protein